MSTNLTVLIQNESSLEQASKQLHDAVFKQESVSFDAHSGIFRLRLWREVPTEVKRERAFHWLTRVKVLRKECELTFNDVGSAEIEVRDRLEYYSLFRLSYDTSARRLAFETEGAVGITLALESIRGTLADTGETTWDQFGYHTVAFRW